MINADVPGHSDLGISRLLRRAAATERARLERALADLRITQGQYALLDLLGSTDGINGADAARAECLTPQTICVIAQNLERMGAIERRPHPDGGRAKTMRLTAHGGDLLSECHARLEGFEARLAGRVPGGAAASVASWLSSLARA